MSIEKTVSRALNEVNKVILCYLPEPTCVLAKQKWRHDVEQAKKRIAAQLNPENNGIEIKITV